MDKLFESIISFKNAYKKLWVKKMKDLAKEETNVHSSITMTWFTDFQRTIAAETGEILLLGKNEIKYNTCMLNSAKISSTDPTILSPFQKNNSEASRKIGLPDLHLFHVYFEICRKIVSHYSEIPYNYKFRKFSNG